MAPSTLEFDKKYAVLIGINSYSDDIIGQLNFSISDVNAFSKVLLDPKRGNYEKANIRLITDESSQELQPLRSNIMSVISSVSSMATTKDSLLVYFSGHGIEKDGMSFLLTHDSHYNVITESAIHLEWLKATLSASNARIKLIILDACHSGAIKGKEGSGVMGDVFAKSISNLSEGFAILSSCKQSEVSWEDSAFGRSIFSYYLTEGLMGAADYDKDKKISLADANRYTFEKVTEWAFAHSRHQTPNMECRIVGEIPLCNVPADFIAPSPMPLGIIGIIMTSEFIQGGDDPKKTLAKKFCGLLLNYYDPEKIQCEQTLTTFPSGKMDTETNCFIFSFEYNDKTSQTVDKIIGDLDSLVRFDTIQFIFSYGVNLGFLVKSSREIGLKIVSYDPNNKVVDIEVPSEAKEFDTVRFSGMSGGSAIEYKNKKGYFDKDFYERINPKTVAGFFKFLQKKKE